MSKVKWKLIIDKINLKIIINKNLNNFNKKLLLISILLKKYSILVNIKNVKTIIIDLNTYYTIYYFKNSQIFYYIFKKSLILS